MAKPKGLFKRPGSDNWQMRFTVAGNEMVKSSGTHIMKTAEMKLAAIKLAIESGEYETRYVKNKDAGIMLLDGLEWYREKYIDKKSVSIKAGTLTYNYIKQFIEIIGNKPVMQVSIDDLETFHEAMEARGNKPQSVDRKFAAVSGMFTKLNKRGKIPMNPIGGKIEYSGVIEPRKRTLLPCEWKALMSAIKNDELKMIATLSLFTGIRLKDVCFLKTDNFNLEKGTITILQYKPRRKDADEITLPMIGHIKVIVQAYTAGRTGPVFQTSNTKVSALWPGIIKGLGIEPPILFPDLRRTFSNRLRNHSAADELMIDTLLGHKLNSIIRRHYMFDELERCRAEIEKALKDYY